MICLTFFSYINSEDLGLHWLQKYSFRGFPNLYKGFNILINVLAIELKQVKKNIYIKDSS